jgi:hypothetical protein
MAYCEPSQDPDEIVLVLSRAEALTLRAITGNATGPVKYSPRKYTNAIWRALSTHLGHNDNDHIPYRTRGMVGRLTFKEWPGMPDA